MVNSENPVVLFENGKAQQRHIGSMFLPTPGDGKRGVKNIQRRENSHFAEQRAVFQRVTTRAMRTCQTIPFAVPNHTFGAATPYLWRGQRARGRARRAICKNLLPLLAFGGEAPRGSGPRAGEGAKKPWQNRLSDEKRAARRRQKSEIFFYLPRHRA